MYTARWTCPAWPGHRMGPVYRYLRTWLLRAWRAGEHRLLPDVALAAALSLAAVWLTIHAADASGGERPSLLVAAGVTAGVKSNTWPPLPERAGAFAILLPIGLFGVAIRAARSRARAADQRAEALEREQQAATRLAVAQERAYIARELHDVVSHHVSVMTIQAGAAGKVLDADPEQARGALSAIEASGRETMTELRHLLGVLTPGPTDDPLHPQPGLDQDRQST